MKKRTIKKGYCIAAVVVLIIVAGAAAYFNAQGNQKSSDGLSLTITRDGEELAVYTLDEIQKMPSVEMEAHLSSGSGEDVDGVYTGVPLSYILKRTDPEILTECTEFTARAGDSFSSALSAEDITGTDTVLVVYQENGKALKSFQDGGTGPMRIMVAGDTYGNRSTQFLVGIECK